jgi:type IV pilus assembly protein PilC
MKILNHRWKGLDAQSNPVEGETSAPSLIVVKHLLSQQGIRLTHCEVARRASPIKPLSDLQFESFVSQLASLMQSGIPLVHALSFISEGFKEANSSEFVARVKSRIESGLALHMALTNEPGMDRSHVQLLKAGELSGNLEQVLSRLSQHLQTRRKLSRSIRSALNYPLIVGAVAIAVIVLVLTEVVPVFEDVFSQMGANLPLPTQMLIQLSRDLARFGPLWLLTFALVMGLASFLWRRFALIRSFALQFVWVIPIIGPLWLLACQQRFATILSVLLEAGLALPESLELAGEVANHPNYRRAGQVIRRRVEQGQSLAESMSQCRIQVLRREFDLFPTLLVHLVKLGEGSGQLEEMLSRWSEDAQQRLQSRLTRLTDWLEPGLVVFMGVVIGGLVVTLYLPMFQMGQHF